MSEVENTVDAGVVTDIEHTFEGDVEVLTDENGNELIFADAGDGQAPILVPQIEGVDLYTDAQPVTILENEENDSESTTEVPADSATSDVEAPTAEA